MVDIFTALLGIASTCALLGAVTKIILRRPKIWDEENRLHQEIEELSDFNEIRQRNPHIWMD